MHFHRPSVSSNSSSGEGHGRRSDHLRYSYNKNMFYEKVEMHEESTVGW